MKKLTFSAFTLLLVVFLTAGCADDQTEDPDMAMDEDTAMMDAAPADTGAMAMGGETLHATLSGDNEVPESGDPDGSGTAEVIIDSADNSVCFTLQVENIAEPQAAHIHSGGAGTAGPPVVDFNLPQNGMSACVDADAATIDQILASPSEYYVNVHNEEYGGGAVRGQLERRSGGM